MELAGLKRAMGFLKDHVNIKTLVTDRHSMVKKYMKDCHAEKNHYFDVWHIAKGNSGECISIYSEIFIKFVFT